MKATYIDHMGDDLKVVNAARTSFNKKSEWDTERLYPDPETGLIGYEKLCDKDAKLIHYLAKHEHFAPFEHCVVTLHLKVPIFIARQIQRHRTFSYSEVSRRYVKDDLEFYWPDKWRKAAENVKQGSGEDSVESMDVSIGWYKDWPDSDPTNCPVEKHIRDAFESNHNPNVEYKYFLVTALHLCQDMMDSGIAPEQARMVLPQSLYTEFQMTGNLRNWIHFLKLRLDSHAQKEVRDIAVQCADIIRPLYPVSFEALMA